MTKPLDPDIKVLKGACRALDGSSSRRMLEANMRFLIDRYITSPSNECLPEHLRTGSWVSKKKGKSQ
ncbi:MAG: hypothetical protein LUQ37_04515 [Methanoregulaceae archaeon]|nr:hypothetical protein [Methanoregulaceae archaeon]